MKTIVPILTASLLLASPAIRADTVYRCERDGRTMYSDKPATDSCTPMTLQVIEPNPEEVARLEEEKRLRAEREREEREQSQRDRLIQAQLDAARAAERQAEAQRRLAEQQARAEEQRRRTTEPYVIWPGFGYPYHRPIRPPGQFPVAPNLPVHPPDGNYPGGADRITVGIGGAKQ